MPVANPDLVHVVPGSPVTVRLLDNDLGVGLILVGLGAPAHGSVAVNPDQSVTYTPAPGYSGEDSFSYTIQDASGGIAESMVSLLVNAAPIAVDDNASTILATPVTVPVLANDIDPEGQSLGLVEVAAPGHGTVTVLPGQSLRYEPQHDFTGIDSFTYSIADIQGATATAMVRVTVAESNGRPVAVPDMVTTMLDTPVTIRILANDSDPDGDPLSLAGVTLAEHGTLLVNPDQSIVYAPAAGYTGEDEFAYTISDGRGGTTVGLVSITVERPNSPPVATNDAVTIAAGASVTLDLLANDSDPDGDPLTLVGVTMPQHGTLSTNPDQSVTYTPDDGFFGEDEFTYTISDGRGGTVVGEVRVTVDPPPVLPTFANGYRFRRRVVIAARQAVDEAADGFVVLVEESGTWLQSPAAGGRVESADGFDLAFELDDGTRLAHEIELYDRTAGRLLAWVRLPAWNLAEDLGLLLYYGKPGLAAPEVDAKDVWADYLAVWDARTGVDRSGNGRHLTPTGIAAGELIGPAGSYPGDAMASRSNLTGLAGHAALTFQCWIKADHAALGSNRGVLAQGPRNSADQDHGLVLRQASSGLRGGASNVFVWSVATSAGIARLESAANAQSSQARGLHGVWRSNELPQLYVDGTATPASWAGSIVNGNATAGQALGATTVMPAGALVLGAGSTSGEPGTWKGLIDEARLRAAAPSAERIAAEHASQARPRTFYGIGDEDLPTDARSSLVALPMTGSTPAGQFKDFDVTTRALVPSGAPTPTLMPPSLPAQGQATVLAGQIRYTPNAGFVGSDSFTYALSSEGKSSTATIQVAVEAGMPSLEPLSPVLPNGKPVVLLNASPKRTFPPKSSIGKLQNALDAAAPGDEIVLANGSYSGDITLSRSGTESEPIVVRAETVDGAILTGGTWKLSGSQVKLQGFRFTGNARLVIDSAVRSRVTCCRFMAPTHTTSQLFWTGSSRETRVDHCEFSGGRERTIIVKEDSSGGNVSHPHIDHCDFHHMVSDGQNTHEPIALGQSANLKARQIRAVIEHNLFRACNAEAEIISVKGSGNWIQYNTFRDDAIGGFSIRQGSGNTVRGNFLLNVVELRVLGKANNIYGNYLDGCRKGLRLFAGNSTFDSPNTGTSYDAAESCVVACNTVVVRSGADHGIGVGDGFEGNNQVAVRNNTLVNNLVFRQSGSSELIRLYNEQNTTYRTNMVSHPAGFTGNGVMVADPGMALATDGLWRPAATSPVVAAGTRLDGQGVTSLVVSADIDGQLRGDRADIGADHVAAGPVARKPLTQADVGIAAADPYATL